MVKHLSRALLLALLVATPVMAQQSDYRYFRDFLLGPAVDLLKEKCATGMKSNAYGMTIFSQRLREIAVRAFLKDGRSLIEANAMVAGEAAAMRQVCPNVW